MRRMFGESPCRKVFTAGVCADRLVAQTCRDRRTNTTSLLLSNYDFSPLCHLSDASGSLSGILILKAVLMALALCCNEMSASLFSALARTIGHEF
jgi:hypothetical protein